MNGEVNIELNKIHNVDVIDGLKQLPDSSIDLIITDPPYYKAIDEEWDKQWKTEEDYLVWCEEWFGECVRVLKNTGVFYCYGNFDILTKQKVNIFDKQLNFRQNITLSKGLRAIAGRTSDKLRMFPTASEYLLYYVKQEDELVLLHQRDYLYSEWKRSGLKISDIKKLCGFTGNQPYNWFSPNNSGKGTWQLPKEEHYLVLQTTGYWQKSYQELKNEFNKSRYIFNLPTGMTDVWDFIPDKVRYGHKTQKPMDITDRIINASSNKNQLILVPFVGSGSECVSAKMNNRNYIGFELNPEYIEIANRRLREVDLVHHIS